MYNNFSIVKSGHINVLDNINFLLSNIYLLKKKPLFPQYVPNDRTPH